MFGNAAFERLAIEKTYDAVCTVERDVSKYSDGIAVSGWEIIALNIPCGLSRSGDNSAQGMANVTDDSRTLFIAPETDIKAGDRVTVTLYGRTETLEAVGIPLLYETHLEVNLQRKVLA